MNKQQSKGLLKAPYYIFLQPRFRLSSFTGLKEDFGDPEVYPSVCLQPPAETLTFSLWLKMMPCWKRYKC